jgi:hypothetical protein
MGEHSLAFQYGFACPTRAELLAVGKAWSVSKATDIIDQVATAVGQFDVTARNLKVRGRASLQSVGADIRRRLRCIQ